MNLDLAARLRKAADEIADAAAEAERPRRSSDDPIAIAEACVRSFLAAIEAGDLDAAIEHLRSDVTYRIPGRSRIAGLYEGIDGFVRATGILPRPGAKNLRCELVELVPSAGHVATFHTLAGTLDAAPFEIDLALRFTIQDGRISAITEYSADQYGADDLFAIS